MAFRDYKSVEAVMRDYPLVVAQATLFPDVREEVPEAFVRDIRFALARRKPGENESYYTENFVYPFLRLVWQSHPLLHVWTRRTLIGDARLSGEPDYLVTPEQTVASNQLLGPPLLAVCEAKRQDFDEGWGQCLAAMLACRAVNGERVAKVYGVVSTGLTWEFGQLEADRFTRHSDAYTVHDPALVNGMLGQLFAACERAVSATADT